MDKWFTPTLNWTCDYLSMLGLKSTYVSKRGHWKVNLIKKLLVSKWDLWPCYQWEIQRDYHSSLFGAPLPSDGAHYVPMVSLRSFVWLNIKNTLGLSHHLSQKCGWYMKQAEYYYRTSQYISYMMTFYVSWYKKFDEASWYSFTSWLITPNSTGIRIS